MILERGRYRFLSRMRRPEGIAPAIKRTDKQRLGSSRETVFEASLASSLSI